MNLRLVLRGVQPRAEPVQPIAAVPPVPAAPAASRPVHFHGTGGVDSPIYRRGDLQPGHVIEGPAIVEQLDATTVVAPGDRVSVDAFHALLMDVAG